MPSYTITYKIADKDSNIIKEGVIISRNRRDEAEARQNFFDYMYKKYPSASLVTVVKCEGPKDTNSEPDFMNVFKGIFNK